MRQSNLTSREICIILVTAGLAMVAVPGRLAADEVVGDLDGDSRSEIAFGSSDRVFVVRGRRERTRARSGQNAVDDVSVYVGQTEVASCMAVGQALVIETHEVEHRRVEVVHVNPVANGGVAELVRCAVRDAAAHATAGEPDGEAVVVVIATRRLGVRSERNLDGRRSAELASADDEGLVEESASL